LANNVNPKSTESHFTQINLSNMQRPSHIEFNPRITPSPTPLPTPPEQTETSRLDRQSMSPVQTRPSPYRKLSRGTQPTAVRNTVDDAKTFVVGHHDYPGKYRHHFDQLDEPLDVEGPTSSEHQVKQDPSGTLKSIACRVIADHSLGI
jgi:hypothetical protein